MQMIIPPGDVVLTRVSRMSPRMYRFQGSGAKIRNRYPTVLAQLELFEHDVLRLGVISLLKF